jgi:hypothetical protein
MKALGRVVGWLLIGIAASIALFIGALFSVGPQTNLPSLQVFTNMWEDGFVSASGTWTMKNDRQAFPIQTSKITCRKSEGLCRGSQAQISMGNTLWLDSDYYTIKKWDNTALIFTTDTPCVEYVRS